MGKAKKRPKRAETLKLAQKPVSRDFVHLAEITHPAGTGYFVQNRENRVRDNSTRRWLSTDSE